MKKMVQDKKTMFFAQNCYSMFIVCFWFSVEYFCLHQAKLRGFFKTCFILKTWTQHEILMSESKNFCLFDEKNDAKKSVSYSCIKLKT